MIYTIESQNNVSQDVLQPVLLLGPDERDVAAEVAELYDGIDQWVIDTLNEATEAKSKEPTIIRGESAGKLYGVLGEAANGAVFAPSLHKIEVDERLQKRAQQLFAPKPETTVAQKPEAASVPKPEVAPDVSPSLPDRLIITGVTKAVRVASRLTHTGKHRRTAA